MRTQRISQSTTDLDHLENTWWNTHATLIELIWAQSFELQKLIRLPYLRKARDFFLVEGKPVLIWEVGCGSGWVGRLIADGNLKILGTDFSEAQIEKAKQAAAEFKKDQFCKYQLTDVSTQVDGHQGILIQAILHHLSDEELSVFFEVISKQTSGTKVFLYEPCFVNNFEKSIRSSRFSLTWVFKQFLRIYVFGCTSLMPLFGKRKTDLTAQLDALFAEANRKDWFLSPKEVPFFEDELEALLNSFFEIKSSYFVNKTDLEIGQNLMLHGIEKPNFLFSKLLIPFASLLDHIFFALDFRNVSGEQYYFKCFELQVR